MDWMSFLPQNYQRKSTVYVMNIFVLVIYMLLMSVIVNIELIVWSRGRGPLKSTMDVIGAAKKISEAGANLDKFCRQVAEQVIGWLYSFLCAFHFSVKLIDKPF